MWAIHELSRGGTNRNTDCGHPQVLSNKAEREWYIACPDSEIASFHETARKSGVQYCLLSTSGLFKTSNPTSDLERTCHDFSSQYPASYSNGGKSHKRWRSDVSCLGAPRDCCLRQWHLWRHAADWPDRRFAYGEGCQWILDGLHSRCPGRRPLSFLGRGRGIERLQT